MAPEEEIVLGVYQRARQAHPNLRLFLAPRQPDRFDEAAEVLRRAGVPFVRRTSLTAPADRGAVVLLDTIGELGAVWGLADVAFVGGSLDGRRGGQNMIEPAAYGSAVVFGPHVWNFKEPARRLIECGAARQVKDAAELDARDAASARRCGGAGADGVGGAGVRTATAGGDGNDGAAAGRPADGPAGAHGGRVNPDDFITQARRRFALAVLGGRTGIPCNMPCALMSSSRSGQWTPSPLPRISKR